METQLMAEMMIIFRRRALMSLLLWPENSFALLRLAICPLSYIRIPPLFQVFNQVYKPV